MTLDEYVDQPFRVFVQREPTTKGGWTYVALNPEIRGCRAQGVTPEKAKEALREARELLFRAMLRHGKTPPTAQVRQAEPVQDNPQHMLSRPGQLGDLYRHAAAGLTASYGLELERVEVQELAKAR